MERLRDDAGSRDSGYMLLEVLVTLLIVSIIAVPVSALLVQTLRTTARAEAAATRLATATTIASIVSRVDVSDECSGDEFAQMIEARGIGSGDGVVVVPDCSSVPTVITVTVSDRYGETELLAVRS